MISRQLLALPLLALAAQVAAVEPPEYALDGSVIVRDAPRPRPAGPRREQAEAAPPPVRDEIRAPIGPIEVSVDGSVGSTYDSNIFRASPVEKRTSGFQSVDDLAVVPQLGVGVRVPVGLQVIEAKGIVAYRLHSENTDLDSFEYSAGLRLRYRLPFACAGMVGVEQRRRLNSYEDVGGDPRRILVRDRLAEGDAACDITPELKLSGQASYRMRRNFDAVLSQYDLDQTTARLELAYGLRETLQPYLAVRYRHREQDNFRTLALPDGSRATLWDAGGGVRYEPSEYFSIDASGAWTRLRENSHVRDATVFSGEVAADWEVTGKTTLHLVADTGYDVSPNLGAIAFRSRGVGLRADWSATPMLTVGAGIGYRRRHILRNLGTLTPLAALRRERDETLQLDASLSYRLTDRLLARAAFAYRDRNGNFEDITYAATTGSIGLTYRFTGPALDVPVE